MSAREDRFYEIFDTVQSKGIKDQFDKQLQKIADAQEKLNELQAYKI